MNSFINVHQDVIWVNNKKDNELFRSDFVDISLQTCYSIQETKQHQFILKITITGAKNCFLLIFFVNSYSIVYTCQVKLDKLHSLT